MMIKLRGKYSKKEYKWKVDISALELCFEADSAMKAFHLLHKYLKKEIHEDLGFDIRIQDHGEFFVVTHTNHSEMVSWLTTKILLRVDSGEILNQLHFEQELNNEYDSD